MGKYSKYSQGARAYTRFDMDDVSEEKIVGGKYAKYSMRNRLKDTTLQEKEGFITSLAKKGGKVALNLIDKMNVASYAVGGMLAGKTASEGVKEKISPSKVFGITNPVTALAIDVFTDPLTYLTLGVGAGAQAVSKTGKVISGTTKVAGKTLSKKGATKLASIVKSGIDDAAKKLKIPKNKLPSKVIDDVFDNAKVSMAKAIEKDAKLVSKFGVGLQVPFTSFKIGAQLPVPGAVADKLAATKAGQIAGKLKTSLDNVFSAQTRKILNSDQPLAMKEAALQAIRNVKDAKGGVLNFVGDTLQKIVKKSGEKSFDRASFFIESVKNGSASKIVKEAIDLIDDSVNVGRLTKREGRNIKEAVKEIVPVTKRIENELIEEGILKGTTDMAYFPRVRDLEDMVGKTFSIGSPGTLKAAKLMPRSIVELIEKGKGGERVIAKLKGRGAKVIEEPVSAVAKLGKEEKALKLGEELKFISKKEATQAKTKVAKKFDTAIDANKKLIREARAKIAKLREYDPSAVKSLKGTIKESEKKITELKIKKVKDLKKIIEEIKEKTLRKTGLKHIPSVTQLDNKLKTLRKKASSLKGKITNYNKVISKTKNEIIKEDLKKKVKSLVTKLEPQLDDIKEYEKILDAKKEIMKLKSETPLAGQKTIPQLQQQIKAAEKRIASLRVEKVKKLTDVQRKVHDGNIYTKKGRVFEAKEITKDQIEKRTGIKYEGALSSLAKGLARTGNTLATNRVVKGMIENVGTIRGLGIKKIVRGKGTELGYKNLYDLTGRLPAAKGYQIPIDVADMFKGYLRFASEPSEIDKFMKSFVDPIQNWWKGMALTGVAYHTRNFVSDSFNMWLGGVKNPFTLTKDMFTYLRTTGIGKITGKLAPKEQALIKRARELGVTDQTFFGSEIAQSIVDQVKKPTFNPLSSKGFLVRGSRSFGEASENARRFGLFMDQVRKGKSAREAADHVKKFLFDYTDLSFTERTYFKRFIPFYTFTRKNLPLQVESLITQPGKLATLSKIETAIEPKNAEEIKKELPEWLREAHPIVLPWKDKDNNPIVINAEGVLPVYDVSRLANKPFKEILNMVSPFIKVPFELAFNQDTFRDFTKIVKAAEENESVLLDLFDTKGAKTKTKFMGGFFNEVQSKIIKDAVRPLRDIDNYFEPGRTDKERSDQWRRTLRFLLLSAQPIDVVNQASFNQYLDDKRKEDLLDLYRKTYKKAVDGSEIEQKNLGILQKTYFKDLGITQEEIESTIKKANIEVIKYKDAVELIDEAIKERRGLNREEKAYIVNKLNKFYKTNQSKRILKDLEEKYKERLKLYYKFK